MEAYCTTCCKRKRRDAAPLPAIRRYLSRRITHVHRLSQARACPLLIFSGKYGLLAPEHRIPWYDRALTADGVEELAARVSRQLAERGITRLVFFALPRATPGWAPYHDVMRSACGQAGVPLALVTLEPPFI